MDPFIPKLVFYLPSTITFTLPTSTGGGNPNTGFARSKGTETNPNQISTKAQI